MCILSFKKMIGKNLMAGLLILKCVLNNDCIRRISSQPASSKMKMFYLSLMVNSSVVVNNITLFKCIWLKIEFLISFLLFCCTLATLYMLHIHPYIITGRFSIPFCNLVPWSQISYLCGQIILYCSSYNRHLIYITHRSYYI